MKFDVLIPDSASKTKKKKNNASKKILLLLLIIMLPIGSRIIQNTHLKDLRYASYLNIKEMPANYSLVNTYFDRGIADRAEKMTFEFYIGDSSYREQVINEITSVLKKQGYHSNIQYSVIQDQYIFDIVATRGSTYLDINVVPDNFKDKNPRVQTIFITVHP